MTYDQQINQLTKNLLKDVANSQKACLKIIEQMEKLILEYEKIRDQLINSAMEKDK